MPLGYNPGLAKDDKPERGGGGKLPVGEYQFNVLSVEERTFKSGNQGVNVALALMHNGREYKSFCNMVYTTKGPWSFRNFLRSVKINPDHPVEAFEIEGRFGRAEFQYEEYNGKEYLRPSCWLAPEDVSIANTPPKQPQQDRYDYGPPPLKNDDVPF